MQLINTLEEWQTFRDNSLNKQSLGLVTTMGALHIGHVSLMKASQLENALTIVSIFVNPTQFNQADDYTHYPRTIGADLEVLEQAGVDICFMPDAAAIYKDNYQFQVIENSFSQHMEGLHRPGHFTGALTVVMKLLNIIRPTRAYFGEKDYQQFRLIHDMADAFFMNTDVQAKPTIREPSGLPYSSRNQRLTPEHRNIAEQFARVFHQPISLDEIRLQLKTLPLSIDYVEEHHKRRFAAVQIGEIRLIDNYEI